MLSTTVLTPGALSYFDGHGGASAAPLAAYYYIRRHYRRRRGPSAVLRSTITCTSRNAVLGFGAWLSMNGRS